MPELLVVDRHDRTHVGRLSVLVGICALSLVVCTSCDDDGPSISDSPSIVQPAPAEAPAHEPATIDPLLEKVCAAYDAESAANPSTEGILSRTALRAVQSGVSEAEIGQMGAHPASLLAYIRSHGDPPECGGFVRALETAQ